jgi:hypothetical protein
MKTLFYLLFICSCLSAQACNSSKSFEKVKYYLLIDKAENYIMSNDYAKASKAYDDAYKLHSTMFAVDLHNALLCNVYLKKWDACEFWTTKLINKGVKKDFFNSKTFGEFKKTTEWSHIEKKYSNYKSKINTEYKRQLDSLVVEDQKVYCSIPTGEINYAEAKENTLTVEEKFSSLITQYGFPTEEKLGISIYNDTIISFVPTFDALVRHGYQSGNAQLVAHFDKALLSGEMDRKIAVNNSEDDGKFVIYDGSMYKMKSKFMNNEDVFREKKLKFINKEEDKGFVIFVQIVEYSNFADEASLAAFHKMYDIFIPNWKEPQ